MRPKLLVLLAATTAVVVSGCSEGSSLSTSAILGGGSAAAPAAPVSTPTSRAFQVGSTAARATKCGYNFDPNKLRGNFLAAETTQAAGADMTNVQKTYDTAYAGVSKAAASKPDYCSEAKTREIKADLSRHLAGDYTPSPPKPVEQDEGIFSGFGSDSGSSSSYQSPTLPTDNSRD